MIFQCPYCDEFYVKEQPLSVHVKKMHKYESEKKKENTE